MDTFEARQAHFVDGDRLHRHRDTGAHGRLASRILTLPGLQYLPYCHTVDLFGRYRGSAQRLGDD
jgi:hypothetical protein